MKRKTTVDADLIVKIGNGDDRAFSELYNTTVRQLFSFLLSLTLNYQDTEDLVQETYINVKKGASGFDKTKNPMTWLFTIAKTLFVSSKRKVKFYAESIDEVFDQCSSGGNSALDSENKIILRYCLSTLAETERQIVVLHAVSGMKHREISAITGLPVATVKTKYNRALKSLAEIIGKED